MRYIWVPESVVKIAVVVYVAATLTSRLSMLASYAGLASVLK